MLKHPHIFIANQATQTEAADMLLYGYIGSEDVIAKDFVRELRTLANMYPLINLHICSGGGSIYEGLAMRDAILNCKVPVDTYVTGIAASMATVLAATGRKRYMSKNSRQMTHRASGFAYGNAEDLRRYADEMESLEGDIAAVYSESTGLTHEECMAKYIRTGADRYITAKQALSEKLIHGITDTPAKSVEVPKNASEKEMCALYMNQFTPSNFLQNDNPIYIL